MKERDREVRKRDWRVPAEIQSTGRVDITESVMVDQGKQETTLELIHIVLNEAIAPCSREG
jgi:hypothetical protein